MVSRGDRDSLLGALPVGSSSVKPRIMYLEDKSGGLTGPARIGRVTFSKTGSTLYYRGKSYRRSTRVGSKANHWEVETGADYWISGCRKDGADRLYGERIPVEIDEDVRTEYWTEIRGLPERANDAAC
jgi:hypothetical protein